MFNQYSNGTNIVFGFADASASALATTIGIRPQTLSIKAEPEFTAEAKNEDGETISYVRGRDKFSFQLDGFIEDEDLFASTHSFTFATDGVDRLFIVNNRDISVSNVDFKKCSITGMAWANITQQDS